MNVFGAINRKYPLHPLVWYLIVETALVRGAFYMAMPFIALRMNETTTSTPAVIGAAIGVGPLVSLVVGFNVGHLSDLWGRRRIILYAALLWVFVFAGLSVAESPLAYAFLMGLAGLARGVFEPVSTALVSDLCRMQDSTGAQQKFAYHLRYNAINIGAAVGPAIGAALLLSDPNLGFRLAGLIYLVSALAFWYFSHRLGIKEFETTQVKPKHTFREVLAVLSRSAPATLLIGVFLRLLRAFSNRYELGALLERFLWRAGRNSFCAAPHYERDHRRCDDDACS